MEVFDLFKINLNLNNKTRYIKIYYLILIFMNVKYKIKDIYLIEKVILPRNIYVNEGLLWVKFFQVGI